MQPLYVVNDVPDNDRTLAVSTIIDNELKATLVKKTLTKATYARVCKLKALVHTLMSRPEASIGELAVALECSPSGVRNYIRDLEALEVVEVARYLPCCKNASGRPVYRIGSNRDRARAIVSWGPVTPEKPSSRTFTLKFTDDSPRMKSRIKDEPTRDAPKADITNIRDPLVAALFGEVRSVTANTAN